MKRDPMMITQFVHFFVLPFMAKQYPQIPSDKLIVTCDAWRSVNNRPFQRWIDPKVDLAQISYNNPFLSHSQYLLPRISEVNELSWLQHQQNLTMKWKSRGYDVTFFCDFPLGTWEVYVAKFAREMLVVPLLGQIEMEVYGDREGQGESSLASQLVIGKVCHRNRKSTKIITCGGAVCCFILSLFCFNMYGVYSVSLTTHAQETVVPFEMNHALTNIGNDTACWMYAVKGSHGSLPKAFMMD